MKICLWPLLVLALLAVNVSADLKRKGQEEEPEVLADDDPEFLDDGGEVDEEDGLFHPPKEEDMTKFEAADAVTQPPPHSPQSAWESTGFTDEPAPVQEREEEELDEDAKLARDLYKSADDLLNKSSSGRKKAWEMMQRAAELGHAGARVRVAWARVSGTHFRQDLNSAKATFEEAAELGNPDAQMGVGFLAATGTLRNSSQASALLHYTFGAFGGSAYAQMALGYRYWSGMGVATSCEKALDYYRRVAESVAEEVSFSGGQTLQRVRLQDEMESGGYSSGILDNDLIEYYQLLADKGDVQAQVGLGQLHYQGGRGVETDHRLAMNYFAQAADSGNPVALAFLGKMYLEGSDAVEQSNDTAFLYFKKAAEQGNPVGQSGLGLMYLYGKGVDKDYKKAFDYFRKAAEQSWVDGQLQLGNMYYNGLGVNRDYKMAIKYFNLASQSGHILAFYNLADMHATGTGMLRSCPTAVELYKNVAERGKWGELMMEAHGDYKRGRTDEALFKYLILAELGYEVAQSNAAFILDRRETDLFPHGEMWKRALVYWTRAAAQGYSAARVRLGDYYYYGWGTAQDFETAAFHYRIASEQQNNAQAMFNLGYMHELGHGMRQDIHLAKRFYDMAAETSADAKVPVALALAKLGLYFTLKNWEEYKIVISPEVLARLQRNWDIYLLTVLLGLLGVLVLFRRTRRGAAAANNRRQQQQRQQQPQQPRPAQGQGQQEARA